MSNYKIIFTDTIPDDELYHFGVLGMKWGVRRFQDSSGRLTEEGRKRYKTGSVIRNIGRALTNTSLGQRVAVNLNPGYKKDKKEIKSEYKAKKKEYKTETDRAARKEKLKSLKSDYKKTLGEARTAAADVIYPWQSGAVNEKIQTQSKAKAFAKGLVAGDGYGAKVYDSLRAKDVGRGKSYVAGLLIGIADYSTAGLLGEVDYVFNKLNSKDKYAPKTKK